MIKERIPILKKEEEGRGVGGERRGRKKKKLFYYFIELVDDYKYDDFTHTVTVSLTTGMKMLNMFSRCNYDG